MRVRATRDFTTGPGKRVAVAKGEERDVSPEPNGIFFTYTRLGAFFGMCKVGDGWEEVKPNGQA